MVDFIRITAQSRYKDTIPFQGDRGPEFGLWEPPEEFTEQSLDDRIHRLKANEIGFPDKLAVLYYGPGTETLWWVIMQANGVIDPELELEPGMILRIPPRQQILAFSSRAGASRRAVVL